nr:vacuolar-processing enzyme-like [Tanacetum cinerariifolium]
MDLIQSFDSIGAVNQRDADFYSTWKRYKRSTGTQQQKDELLQKINKITAHWVKLKYANNDNQLNINNDEESESVHSSINNNDAHPSFYNGARESIKVKDNDKPKGNNVDGPIVVNMVDHNNSSSHLRIEESIKVKDNDKPKGNNVAGPIVVNMVDHNNSS